MPLWHNQWVLSLGGAQIDPGYPRDIGSDLEVNWSVRLDKVGPAEGFISVLPSEEDQAWQLISIDRKHTSFLVIGRNDVSGVVERYGTPLAFAIGLIISFSNLFRFIWAWSDRGVRLAKEEADRMAEAEAKRPKIHLR